MRCEVKQEDGGGPALSCRAAPPDESTGQAVRRAAQVEPSLNLTVTSTEHTTLPSLPCRVGTCQATQLTQKLLPVL